MPLKRRNSVSSSDSSLAPNSTVPSVVLSNNSDPNLSASLGTMNRTSQSDLLGVDRDGGPVSSGEFKQYKRRWILLSIVFFLNYTNATMWICFAPVADSTASYFGVSLSWVNMLTAIYFIIFIPFNFVGTYMAERFGLKPLMISAALINMIGGLLRVLAIYLFDDIQTQFIVLFIGQSITAVAQAFILIQPTKLAAYWFAPDERTIANAAGTIANEFGLMVAFLATPFIVNNDPSNVEKMVLVWSLPSVIPSVICLVFVRTGSYPPIPPSPSGAVASMGFKDSMKQCLKSKQFWYLMLSFGTGLAAFSTLISLLEQVLCVNGYTDTFSGITSTVAIGSGCIGAAIFGTIADNTKKFDFIYKVCYLLACLGIALFAWAASKSDNEVFILLGVGWFGFFGLVLFPLALELSVECTYPVSESASSGIVILAGQLIGIVMLVGLPMLGQDLTSYQNDIQVCAEGVDKKDLWIANLVLSAFTCLVGVFTVVFFNSPDKRIKTEAAAASVLSSSANNC
ncbi:solute carrier family 49 member A3-like isoform X1 [Convolutriloba macropyga]|uniref:solute carrier family 49 member A3-like isoform X1 n=1 Tax=Convolutriloba macropyga TaxID=536237 RepID=UPI003F528FC4